MQQLMLRHSGFQSTLPVRGATATDGAIFPAVIISIHAPREGSDYFGIAKYFSFKISIHAPREGSDGYDRRRLCQT